MTGGCRNAFGTNEPVYYFDDNGSLVREKWNSGSINEYSTDSFGIVTCTDTWGKPRYIFDTYGNRISFYLNGERHEYQGYMYDEWHNRKDDAINTYNENSMLQSVCYRKGNLQIQTDIQYQQIYIPDGAEIEDTVWKNIRIICGEAVWYY
jgi:hypothetical protein